MKKNLTVLVFIFLLKITVSLAQVPNSGFESLNADGSVSNWGNVYLMSFSIADPNSIPVWDSIEYDHWYFSSTSEAHSGLGAIEMRNSYNYRTNTGTAGSVSADISPIFSGWSSFQFLPVQIPPTELSFYFKYFPVNNDTAVGSVLVFDQFQNLIGEAKIEIGGTHSSYTYATTPIVYSTADAPASVIINFSTAKTGGTVSLGTRFLVDDVSLNSTTGIQDTGGREKMLSVYPNPARQSFSASASERIKSVSVQDVSGKETQLHFSNPEKIDCSRLSAGVYFLTVKTEENSYREKLIIEK